MNYDRYRMSFIETLKVAGIFLAVAAGTAYLFYESVIAFFMLLPALIPTAVIYMRKQKERRRKRLAEEFAETLRSVSASMKAGYSAENAFLKAQEDMRLFYGKSSLMTEEIARIRKGLDMNVTLEDLIKDLADRSRVNDIVVFASVLGCAKRYGGNIPEVLFTAAENIRGKICVDKEIELIIAEKKLELRMMEVLPFFILVYMRVTSGGYFNVLYEGLTGRLFMTGCLIVYILAAFAAERMIKKLELQNED